MRKAVLLAIALGATGCAKSTLDLGSASPTPSPADCNAHGVICSVGGSSVGDGGPFLQASLGSPHAGALDAAGDLFLADGIQNRIREITPDGVIHTLVGDGQQFYPQQTGVPGLDTTANHPDAIAVCPDGWVIWGGWYEDMFWGLDPATGDVTWVAGAGYGDAQDDVDPYQAAFRFDGGSELSCDARNVLFFVDGQNGSVRALNRGGAGVTVAGVTIAPGRMRTVAGTGTPANDPDGSQATATRLYYPNAVTTTPDGGLLVSENCRVRRISPAGIVSTVAGTTSCYDSGDGGAATAATFGGIGGIAVDGSKLFVMDGEQRVRLVNLDTANGLTFGGATIGPGQVQTVGGGNGYGPPVLDGGPAVQQLFSFDEPACLVRNGNLLVFDDYNAVVREIDGVTGNMSVVGGFAGSPDFSGYLDGPTDVDLASDGSLLISAENPRLFRQAPAGGPLTVVAGGGAIDASGDGGPATVAGFWATSTAVGPDGSIYVADNRNERVRKIDPSGTIHTVAGNGSYANGGAGDGGPALNASFDSINSVAVDSAGNLFLIDRNGIRFVNEQASALVVAGVNVAPGAIATIAGSVAGFGFQDGPAAGALFDPDHYSPSGIVVQGGSVYVGDFYNHRIRRIDLAAGTVETIAGSGLDDYLGDGGHPLQAAIGRPRGLALHDGWLYFTQEAGSLARRMKLPDGPIEPVAGNGKQGFWGDGGLAVKAEMFVPRAIAVAADGTVYIADRNHRIRRVAP